MSGFRGIAARRGVGLFAVIGLLGGCATGRQEAASARETPSQSVERLMQECTGGNAEKCGALGVLYHEGNGVARDEGRAAAPLGKACEGGDAKSCSIVGELHEEGLGVPQTRAGPLR